MYVKIDTLDVVSAQDIIRAHPNVSFPNRGWSDDDILSFGYAELNRPLTHPFPMGDEMLVDGVPYEDNGKWYLPWVIYNPSPEEIAQKLNQWRNSAACTPFQGRMALANAGLLAQVQSLIDNPATDEATKIAWEYAIEWRRTSPLIQSLMSALAISDSEADSLFKNAADIQA